jgi:4-hydroxy-2-oxoheptanedioate aldolase
MTEIPRLNPAIRALEAGQPAFVTFSPAEISAAQAIGATTYDAVVFEMEHNPYDVRQLRDCMQYMLDRAQIVKSASLPPAVAPMVRIPPNGGEMNQFIAKQVLDIGVYGIVWPHVGTVEEARNAVQACRYPRPREAAYYEPAGQRGDTWPLNPEGEVLVVIMCEEKRAIRNLPKTLKEVPGIGVVLIGEGDLSQDMGYPRQYDHPEVAAAIDDILAICKEAGVPCGHPHVDSNNVEKLIEKGFRWLMPAPSQSFAALEKGLKAAGRR